MFKLLCKLFKKEEVKEKQPIIDKECKGYSNTFFMPNKGFAFKCGGSVAKDYLIDTIIEYLKFKGEIELDKLDIEIKEIDSRGFYESISIEIKSVTSKEKAKRVDFWLNEYFERLRFLHSTQKIIKPILDITPLDLDHIGYVEGYVKFEDLEDYRNHFKAIKVHKMPYYLNDLEFYLSNKKEVVVHKDLCNSGFYSFTFDLNGDEGFYWKVKFYEKQPIDLSKDYQSIVIEVANKLVCSNYFIGKIK